MRLFILALLVSMATSTAMAADRALDTAIRHGDLAAARAAIAGGDAVDEQMPPFLMTPLAVAAIRGDLPMVRLLLDAGADPNTPGIRGMNALSAATHSCRAGPEVIAALIDAGANLEDRSGADETPLMSAIQEDRTDIALQLIAAGSDINTRNQYGDGVLNYAIYTRNPVVVQAAMQHGVDTSQLNLLFTTAAYRFSGGDLAGSLARSDCGQQG